MHLRDSSQPSGMLADDHAWRFLTRPLGRGPVGGGAADPYLYAAIVLSMACVLIADIYTPLGIAVWVFYLVPMVLTLFLWSPAAPLAVAGMTIVCLALGFFLSPEGMGMDIARINRGFGVVTVVLVAIIGFYFIRNKLAVRREEWLQSGQTGLSARIAGELGLDELGGKVLGFLAEYLDAEAGAFFALDGTAYRRFASYGAPLTDGAPEEFRPGDGLLGQAAADRRPFLIADVPEGYLTISSALGRGKPRHLLIAPFVIDDGVNAVLEVGFLHPPHSAMPALLARVSESVGVAVRSAHYRRRLESLLKETQRQAEELQAQSEELRVTNEELEEQSRALKESQARLEQQQAELEQTNSQLEEQTQVLEAQRDELARSGSQLQMQARELEQASRYKSDFLANMSHELRTPLNSSLILARLLADNPAGNLTAEQVQYAQTIQSAGNDLLLLINDILDLSKIEAGRMELRPEPIAIKDLLSGLSRLFEPMAAQKQLEFSAVLAPDAPAHLETDRQRLEQVLKNLLSNALKFTDQGRVAFAVARAAPGRVAFTVADTGIGIPDDQQQAVFENFRQADSTTSRKYGGTGLGLSISRELVRLLGGTLTLTSKPDQGSTFTVTIPEIYDPALVPARAAAGPAAPRSAASLAAVFRPAPPAAPGEEPALRRPAPLPPRVADDREQLTGDSRVILVVEDDETFAGILGKLVHELNFQCLIATTAEEGLALAVQYRPSAVILDLLLPDHSGLIVLDRLKHDARTQHIPVHIVSASDEAQAALALGAIGYIVKPVDRDQLVEALQRIESRLAQRLRRVLVVEDDPVQLESLRQLLSTQDVEMVGTRTAADCLERLRHDTFDCMVLDLALPDSTGYALLETLSREDAYSFPPVIVYTGRELSADDEQKLRRYSKSIIIKGAKSPERLLDEVTLFLHQVVAELPPEKQRMLQKARSRDAALEGRRILVVEDDVRNLFAVTSILEPRGAIVQIARNGREALDALEAADGDPQRKIDLVLMDVMMPEMDGLTATRKIRAEKRWGRLPIIMLTAKAMRDDQEECHAAGANDYLVKPLDVEKLLSLVRVWMPR